MNRQKVYRMTAEQGSTIADSFQRERLWSVVRSVTLGFVLSQIVMVVVLRSFLILALLLILTAILGYSHHCAAGAKKQRLQTLADVREQVIDY